MQSTQSDSRKSNLPWVEKYRPKKLDDLISHTEILSTLGRFLEEGRLPHLLFYGPPGTGKTSAIMAIARRIYSPQQLPSMVLELNASDDRGIGVVREKILNFASTRSMFKGVFKLILLDEADAMTNDAQNALRRVIEKYTENTRFCLICNYLSKIIPAIQSRCTRFRFAPLSTEQMLPRLQHVMNEESVPCNDEGLNAVVRLASGDMRKALNIFQSAFMAYGLINEENVYNCVGHPQRADVEAMLKSLLNHSFSQIYEEMIKIKITKGLALQDILYELHEYVHRIDFPAKVRMILLQKMADIEFRLSHASSDKIQLSGLISAFQSARDLSIAATE